jgi:hypothetical protein
MFLLREPRAMAAIPATRSKNMENAGGLGNGIRPLHFGYMKRNLPCRQCRLVQYVIGVTIDHDFEKTLAPACSFLTIAPRDTRFDTITL